MDSPNLKTDGVSLVQKKCFLLQEKFRRKFLLGYMKSKTEMKSKNQMLYVPDANKNVFNSIFARWRIFMKSEKFPEQVLRIIF